MFLNPDRVSMPDIDVDFSPEIREDMFKYVAQKYGEAHVSHIATLDFYDGKKAVRTAAKLVENEGVFPNLKEEINKLYTKFDNPFYKLGDFLAGAYENSLEFLDTSKAEVYFPKEIIDKTIEFARNLQGIPSGFGVHAAGCIISDKDITEYAPVKYTESAGEEISVIESDCVQAESDFGLLKMDFLGLKTLKIISDTKKLINEDIDLSKISFEPEVFEEVFAKGNTAGIFQFDSDGMINTLKSFKPQSFNDVVLMNAVYRPGPMDFIPSIIKVKEGKEKPKYFHPMLKDILDITYGSPVFQEQIMKILQEAAGFTLGQADICRRAMSKKKADVFQSFKSQFIAGAVEKGAKKTEVEAFWESLLNFSSYAFNLSHSVAYSLVAYRSAWLKYHYPKEFACAVMANTDSEDKKTQMLVELKEKGIKILPADFTQMEAHFTPKTAGIMIGYKDIKGIKGDIKAQVTDFDSLLDADIDVSSIIKLIEVGAFDFLNCTRNELITVINMYKKKISDLKKKRNLHLEQREELLKSLCEETELSMIEVLKSETKNIKNISVSTFNTRKEKIKEEGKKAYELSEKIKELKHSAMDYYFTFKGSQNYINLEDKKKEKTLLGFYASGDPLDNLTEDIRNYWENLLDLKIKPEPEDEECLVAGLVTKAEEGVSKNGNKYIRIIIDDKLYFCFNEDVKDKIKKENLMGDVFYLYLFKAIKKGDFKQITDIVTPLQLIYKETKVIATYEKDLEPLKGKGNDLIIAFISSENRFVKFLGSFTEVPHVKLLS